MNWQLIGAAADSVEGTLRELLKRAYDEVEDEEDEHLYHTTGWARELHLQALGLPAQLPPVKKQWDVTTELEAAEVRKAKKGNAASHSKGDQK